MAFPKFPIVPKKPAMPAPKKAPAPAPAPAPKVDAAPPKKSGPEVIDAEWERSPAKPALPGPVPPPKPKMSLGNKAAIGAAGLGAAGLGAAAGADMIGGGGGGGGGAKDDANDANDAGPAPPTGGMGLGRQRDQIGGPRKPDGAFAAGGDGGWAVVNPPANGFPVRERVPGPAGPNIRPPANPKPPVVQPGVDIMPNRRKPGDEAERAVPVDVPGKARQGDLGGVDLSRNHRPEHLDAVNAWRNEILGSIQNGNPVDKRGRADLHNIMSMEHRMKQGNVTPQMREEYSRALDGAYSRYGAPRVEAAKARNEAYRSQATRRGQMDTMPAELPAGTYAQNESVMQNLGGGASRPEEPRPVVKRSRAGSPVRYNKTSYIMASSNIKEDPNKTNTPQTPGAGHANTGVPITYQDSVSTHKNDTRTQVSTGKAADYIKRYTGGQVTSSPGYGVWSDGSEDSVVHQVHGDVSHEDLRKAAANVGYTQGQKAVLAFTPHEGGSHFFSTFDAGNTDPNALIKELSDHGVDNKTLVPNETGGFKVHVFDDPGMTDGKPAATQALHGWAAAKGVNVTTESGTGSFVGSWGTRHDGKHKYWQEDPTLKPGSSRPYADRQIITQKGGGMRLRYSAEQAGADAKRLMGTEPSAGSLAVMTRYLQELHGSDPDKFGKLMQQHDAPGRELHYKWLDGLGGGTVSLLKHLSSQSDDPNSKLAKSVMSDPSNYRRNLRDLHHNLLDSGFYQPGVRPVWPDKERLMEVSGKLKQTGRLGELDQYIRGVQQGQPMIDLEESDAPAPPQDDGSCKKCGGK